jgi:hypothetical protein
MDRNPLPEGEGGAQAKPGRVRDYALTVFSRTPYRHAV